MKKYNRIILAILVLATAVFFYLKNQDRSSNLTIKPDFFQIKDTQEVSKVFISDRNGNSATLDRKSFYWTINQGFRADRNSVNNMFEVLVKMRISAPVSDGDAQEMIKEMTVAQMKVEVYKNNKLDRTLFIGNATADGLATYVYAANEGLDRPYIVHIPGWNGNLGPRFFLKEMAWRSKKVFNLSPILIEYIQIDFSNKELISYRLENVEGAKPTAIPLNASTDSSISINENRVKEVFMNSGKLFYEDFLLPTAKAKIDSIYKVLPTYALVTIKVKNKEPMQLILKEQPPFLVEDELEEPAIIDRFYAYFANDESQTIGVLQKQMAAKLLKNFDRFENSK